MPYVVSSFLWNRAATLLRGFQSLNIVLPWDLIEVVISCDCVETSGNRIKCEEATWINYAVDHLRTSPITGIALSYLPRRLRRSNQDLSFLDRPRSSSIPQAPASSIYVLSLDFLRFSLDFATSLDYPRSLDFPRFLSTYVVSLDFPRFRRSSGYLSFPRFLRSARSSLDLPRLRSPASFTLELYYYYRVLLRYSIGAIAFLDRSSLECLYKPFWM